MVNKFEWFTYYVMLKCVSYSAPSPKKKKRYCYFLSNIEGFFQSNSNTRQNFTNTSFKTSKSNATLLTHCKQQSSRTATAIEQPSTSLDGNERFIKYSITFYYICLLFWKQNLMPKFGKSFYLTLSLLRLIRSYILVGSALPFNTLTSNVIYRQLGHTQLVHRSTNLFHMLKA
jgi:hypothetical protein